MGKYATIVEVRGRVDVISDDLNKKIQLRPTMDTFKSTISLYDEQIKDCVKSNIENKDLLTSVKNNMEDELDSMQTNIKGNELKIERKIEKAEL